MPFSILNAVFGKKSSQTKQTQSQDLGRGLGDPLSSSLLQLMNPNQQDTGLASLLGNVPRFNQIGDTLANTAFGGQLDPAATPQGAAMISALLNASNRNLGSGLADLRSRFAQAGHTSTGGSSPLLQAQKQAITDNSQNFNNTLANMLFDAYKQERGHQMQGLNQLGQYEMTPAQMLSQFLPFFKTQTGTTEGPKQNTFQRFMGGLSQDLGLLGGLFGGKALGGGGGGGYSGVQGGYEL